MIYLGTSGFSHNDWVGNFYPVRMPKREWLTYYTAQFPCSFSFNHRNWNYFFASNYRHGQTASTIRQLQAMLG